MYKLTLIKFCILIHIQKSCHKDRSMSIHHTIQKQYQRIVDTAATQTADIQAPPEGWVVTVRKALGMSGAQLARRLGITRAAISQREKAEINGGVSLKQMQKTAEALGCKFVYAIVPDDNTKAVIHRQAMIKANAIVKQASGHMALESQSLTHQVNIEKIEELAKELMRDQPSNYWDSNDQ